MAKVYELMNYSDFGTLVDGIHYTCNISANSSVKVVLESNMIKTSTSNSRRIHKLSSKPTTKNVENTEREKKTRSSVTAAETRSQCKKLLQKIDTIARKTHDVTSFAEEDLNEIARNVKLVSSMNTCAPVQESSSNIETPRPRKRGRPPLNAQRKNGTFVLRLYGVIKF